MSEFNYEAFQEKLEKQLGFPTVYMFKFIVQVDHRKIALIESLFSSEADIHTKMSNNGKYISITAKEVVISAAEIIEVYKKAATIEGVISL